MEEIQELFAQYVALFPQERAQHETFAHFLENSPEFFNRKTLPGHITSSGLIWNPDRQQWLVIYHPTFQQWQQTGGHNELEDLHVWDTALREALEETTLTQIELHPWHHQHHGLPIAIDTHTISPNAQKQEAQHFHFDWEYIVITHQDAPNTSEQKWVNFQEGLPLVTQPLHSKKVEELLFSL